MLALEGVDAEFRPGEIHAILGENGAGKSTLVRLLAGFLSPDAGSIHLDGIPLPLGDPLASRRAGIELVHQHFMLAPALTVRENIELARMARLGGLLGRESGDRAEQIGRDLGWPLDLSARIQGLSVGARQRVEIIKALVAEPRVLILDEPTAALAPPEVADLFRVLRRLATAGMIVILIAHKLSEVRAVAERATILRQGRKVGERVVADSPPQELERLMIGREAVSTDPSPGGERVIFEARDFGPHRITLSVREGEIFGIGGVEGNGQRELAEQLAGVIPATGEVWLNAIRQNLRVARIGYIPEDRNLDGLAPEMTIAENLALGGVGRGWLKPRELRALSERAIEEFWIGGRPTTRAAELSGGNAQKVVVARALSPDARGSGPDWIVAVNPTRGLDLGARETVFAALRSVAQKGVPTVLISTDLDELFALASRTAFLARGQLREGRDPALMLA